MLKQNYAHYFGTLLGPLVDMLGFYVNCKCRWFNTSYSSNSHYFYLLNGTTATSLPLPDAWENAYTSNSNYLTVIDFLTTPSTFTNKTLHTVHFKYRQPIHQSNIINEGNFLFLKENVNKNTFTKLRIVPNDVRNVTFLTFYSNPIVGY